MQRKSNAKELTNGLAYRKASRADIEHAADSFSETLGLSSRQEAFRKLDKGEWAGTVIAEELHMLRFLLDGTR